MDIAIPLVHSELVKCNKCINTLCVVADCYLQCYKLSCVSDGTQVLLIPSPPGAVADPRILTTRGQNHSVSYE